MPNYGPNSRPHDAGADFLLGGNRKRLIIEALAAEAWSATELVDELDIGRSTVFEVIRALWSADALELDDGRYRLARRTALGRSLRALVAALAEGGEEAVDRPPRPRRRGRAAL
jgi:DNA-binding HxlR family transcriptional regulator